MTTPRISTVMWPTRSWPEAGELWRRAEDLGFRHAWVYDHIAWRGATPWYDAYTTLAAAAAVTSRVRIGTMVTSPNFRHPVPTAHAVRTIDHVSGGRLTVGVGAGGLRRTSDAGVLGGADWTPGERASRFAEWVELLDLLLRGPETTFEGTYYSAREVVQDPGCVQRPRVPFVIAANGPRGMRVAARHGDAWVTTGAAEGMGPQDAVRSRLAALDAACEAEGREITERILLTGFAEEPWLASPGSFADLAGRYAELGVTEIVLHWPRPGTPFESDPAVFEAIAAEHGGDR
ncbi:LLM class flavin-dependent oxidoreductase [Actinomadura livida]|uniref:Alkanesulfonate monooxygenase SsuD/methylene tetrahydromethanopterin reductase-like flavin-dependent oxidoreductase (Luciferase family) n=1 Tax=Actinomadura livida TaxID=79909 RepID=A0A7W7IDU8_9ACTN|nr:MULTISPECIES: LLM class flavin-dependent oxidoreductase [Actinomadura]MBB4775079.1 alkanesulfonate monooxygenase SsuD/methylene tetrahydromethanopterin reductase-like flavin-dependent oxidoreductase (luciferase family) [Actinomadura catellatispora]GGT87644.1 luciferase [Actinomadura livida]